MLLCNFNVWHHNTQWPPFLVELEDATGGSNNMWVLGPRNEDATSGSKNNNRSTRNI